jgi:hypothetical protein
MNENFFTKEQRDFVRHNLRVGGGYIIVKSDEGITAFAPVYIDRESGQVYNPVTGNPMIILLGDVDEDAAELARLRERVKLLEGLIKRDLARDPSLTFNELEDALKGQTK